MGAHMTTRGDHTLNVRVLRFNGRAEREEPAMLALDLCARGRARDAIEVASKALAKSPDDGDVLLALGRAYHQDGQHARAQAALVTAANVDRDWAEPYVWLFRSLSAQGRNEKAAGFAARAVELGAEDADLAPFRKSRSLDARLARFRTSPRSEDPTLLAVALLDANRVAEARALIEPSLAADPEDEDLRVLAAQVGVAVPLVARVSRPAPAPVAVAVAASEPTVVDTAAPVMKTYTPPVTAARPLPVLARQVPVIRAAAKATSVSDTVVDCAAPSALPAPRRTPRPETRPRAEARSQLFRDYLSARLSQLATPRGRLVPA